MTTYTLEAFENYDATWVTGLDTNAIPFTNGLQDKINVGVRFDPVSRKIFYAMFMYDADTETNATGHTLWDGFTTPIINGGTYDATQQKCQWMATKHIDTGAVTFYNNFDATKTVPTGIGPTAIGEYDFTTNPTNGQNIVLNGVTWTFVTSGASGTQTNIKATTLATINQLSWDLNGSVNSSLTPAYYTAGDRDPPGTVCLGITYKLGGTAGNAYTLAVGTYGGVVSGATLTGGATPSDGTWRRFVESTSSEDDADPLMVDPRTGNVWQHTDSDAISCAIYHFRASDNYAQVISPYSPPPGQSSHMELVGISDAWTYVRFEQGGQTHVYTITLTPRTLTAQEIALDAIVAYAEFVYDPLWNDYYFRAVFNHSTSMFTYGGAHSGTRAFKLYKFDEPSAAPFGGPVTGGGFTDITPWGPSTGPNSNVAAYTVDGRAATPSTGLDNKYSLYYLPGTNELVIINKLWAGDTSTGWTDPTLTRFDCTYVDIGGGTFDYHEGFVTGYMTSDWATTTDPMAAAWVVLRVRELDLFLGQNTYDFSGLGRDYTKRWFYFDVQPVVGGVWAYDRAKYYTIMVQYQFTSNAVPLVKQVITEAGWDAAYTAYAASIGNDNVVFNSIGDFEQNDQIYQSGISDGNTFIWDGYANGQNTAYLNPAYLPDRRNYFLSSQAVGPFVRLSFSALPPPVVLGSGFMIERMDNRIWAAAENAWCVDCGLTTDLPTPSTTLNASSSTGAGIPTAVALSFGGQGYSSGTTASIVDPTGSGAVLTPVIASGIITSVGVSGGTNYTNPDVVFTDPAETGAGAEATITLNNHATFVAGSAVFNSGMVGEVIRMGGGLATITAFTDSTHVTANITSPIVQVIPNTGGIPAMADAGEWSVAPNITTVGGLWHLIGFTVTGVADGEPISPRVVASDGTITLDAPASLVTVGLGFLPQFQTLYLDAGNPTIQGQRKKVSSATARLESTGVAGVVVGANQPDGAALNPPRVEVAWTNMSQVGLAANQGQPPYGNTIPPLFTGDTLNIPITSGFAKPGQVALQQNLPLPLNILAVVPDIWTGDAPSESYPPEEPKGRR